MYRNQRPIFTPFFLTPIIKTLKTEEGEIPKKLGGGGEIPKRGSRSLGEGQITRDLARGGKSLGGKIPTTPGCLLFQSFSPNSGWLLCEEDSFNVALLQVFLLTIRRSLKEEVVQVSKYLC